jgi:septum formation protein
MPTTPTTASNARSSHLLTMPKPARNAIYLASQSPRRADLLKLWGVDAQVLVPGVNELAAAEALEAVLPGERALAYVKRVTRLKLEASVQRMQARGLPARVVLCADTTVALDGDILGKPSSAAHARRMLAALSGRTHQVLTAVAVGRVDKAGVLHVGLAVSRSSVRFAPLSPAQVKAYVATGEPMGKAGAYAIQGMAALFAQHISGSYSGIMGLPAYETAQLLGSAGVKLAV